MALQEKNFNPAIMAGATLDVTVDLGEIRDSNSNEILEFDAVASAVNNVTIANAASGANPIIYSGGDEADTGLTLAGGDGTNIEEILVLDQNASAVNEVTIDNAATGVDPSIAATGDDAIIGLQLTPKGTAVVLLGNVTPLISGTVVAGKVTLNAQRGVITTASAFTTGTAKVVYSVDFVNNKIWPNSVLLLTLVDVNNSTGLPVMGKATIGSGSATVRILNADTSPAGGSVDGSARIHFAVLN